MTPDPDRLRTLLAPDWTAEREDAVLRRLQQSERTSRSRWWIMTSAGMAMAAAVVVALLVGPQESAPRVTPPAIGPLAEAMPQPALPPQTPPSAVTPPAPAPPPAASPSVVPLQFRDGSAVVPDDVDSELVIAEASTTMTRVELRRGGARFDVTPNPERRFRVEAGLVTVDVLGTEFHCRREGDGVVVEVIRGQVSVSWPEDSRILERGDSGLFPPPPSESSPEDRPLVSSAAPRWRRLARKGESVAAYEALEQGQKVANRAEELMLAADVARKAGHPAAALPYLQRVIDDHPKNSRAPLAAFTMGRIEQGRRNYRAAAEHFAKVREMKGSSLIEHALAREVEAWSAAGDKARARRHAKDYLDHYPDGPRAPKVRRALAAAGG